ncbi:MAG TPA: sterol desaturase family protein [Acidimicrobiales bacterium]
MRTPRQPPGRGATLGELVRYFFTKPSPLAIGAVFASAVVARLRIGRPNRWDIGIPAMVVVLEPFTEWLVHTRLLHWKPTKVGPLTIDPVTARKHREHHANPRDLSVVMVPFQALFPAAPLLIALAVRRLRPPQAAAAIGSGFGMLLYYEWIHYLIHSPYRPSSEWFRRLSRNHRLHHFKNEHQWFGVTTNMGDRLLGTNPDESDVPTSDTARTLGVVS